MKIWHLLAGLGVLYLITRPAPAPAAIPFVTDSGNRDIETTAGADLAARLAAPQDILQRFTSGSAVRDPRAPLAKKIIPEWKVADDPDTGLAN